MLEGQTAVFREAVREHAQASWLQQLEAESIDVIREAVAERCVERA